MKDFSPSNLMHIQQPEKCRNVVSPHPAPPRSISISRSASFTPERYFPISQQNLKDIRHLLSKASCPGACRQVQIFKSVQQGTRCWVLLSTFLFLSLFLSFCQWPCQIISLNISLHCRINVSEHPFTGSDLCTEALSGFAAILTQLTSSLVNSATFFIIGWVQQRGYFSLISQICSSHFCCSDPWTPEGPCPVQSPPSTARGQPHRVLPSDDQPAKPLWWPADAERRGGGRCSSCSSCSSSTRLHQPRGWWAFFKDLSPVSSDLIWIQFEFV